jgi:hypothetical protein
MFQKLHEISFELHVQHKVLYRNAFRFNVYAMKFKDEKSTRKDVQLCRESTCIFLTHALCNQSIESHLPFDAI